MDHHGSSKPPLPRKEAGNASSGSKSSAGAVFSQEFPPAPARLPESEPMFQWYDVTHMYKEKPLTPNSAELYESHESPPRTCCRFFLSDVRCPLGYNCPNLHTIFGMERFWAPPLEEGMGPLAGSKRKAADYMNGSENERFA